jgi:hypothetical protein
MIKELMLEANKKIIKQCDDQCSMCIYNKSLEKYNNVCEAVKYLAKKEEIIKIIQECNDFNLNNIKNFKSKEFFDSGSYTIFKRLSNEYYDLVKNNINKDIINEYLSIIQKTYKEFEECKKNIKS